MKSDMRSVPDLVAITSYLRVKQRDCVSACQCRI